MVVDFVERVEGLEGGGLGDVSEKSMCPKSEVSNRRYLNRRYLNRKYLNRKYQAPHLWTLLGTFAR